jgi:hypothetical protein
MRVPEEPVCIDLFRQNPVFTSLHLKSPIHVTRPLGEKMQKEILENGRARPKKFNESQQLAVWKRRAELNYKTSEPAFIWQKNTFDKTYKMQCMVWNISTFLKTVRSKTRSIK